MSTPVTQGYSYTWFDDASQATASTTTLYVVTAWEKVSDPILKHPSKKPRFTPPYSIRAPYKGLPKEVFQARHGYQQMCRLPCYRGARTR